MNARATSSIILLLLALLPSPYGARRESYRHEESESVAPIYEVYATEERFNDFVNPPGNNKPGHGRGPPGGHGPPGLSNRGPPGQNVHNFPPGWNKVNKGKPPEEQIYPDTNNRGSTSLDENKDGPYPPDNRQPDRNENPQDREQCREDEFHCRSNECLPSSVYCDDKADCRDASDEAFCITNRNEKDSCVLPPQPKNGRYELGGCDNEQCDRHSSDRVPKNSILTYKCNNNYILLGNSVSVCTSDGWCCNNISQPACVKMCPALNSISVDFSCNYQGETVSCSKHILPGTRARLSCKSSYKLSVHNDPGYREINCLENGTWNRYVFRCLPECGLPIPHGNTLIINGFEAKVGTFPWHVGIYRKKSDMTYEQICGGTLISSNLIISAAHCFYDEVFNKLNDASNYAVAAGKHYRAWDVDEQYNQKSMIENVQLGARYQGARGNFAEDIALVKLRTPFELTALVQPICMDWNNVYEREQLQLGQSGKVVGWGKNIKGEPTQTLYEIDMPYVPYSQCLSVVPINFRGYITPDKFCAGRLNGSSLCEGDSGGGLCFEKHGIWYLRGVVSVSPVKEDFCDYNSYVAFTYISHFLEFIREAYINT